MSPLPELLFASSDPAVSRQLSGLVAEGRLRPLVPRAYTSNLDADLGSLVRRHLFSLIGHLYPGSMLAFRTGLTFAPADDGAVYLHGLKRRPVKWPGHTLYFTEGSPALPGDHPLGKDLVTPSRARALLENLRGARRVDGRERVLDQEAIELLLVQEIDAKGAVGLNLLRDQARGTSETLDWRDAFAKLDEVISAIQSTRPAKVLKSRAGKLHHLGKPYDGSRITLFESLATHLLATKEAPEKFQRTFTVEEYEVFAFYESYFSNFIEGTEFTVEEAERIVFDGEDIPTQLEDSHDVRALYVLCSDPQKMQLPLTTDAEFLDWMRTAHGFLLEKRPSKRPGRLKVRANRAGDTEFVRPEYVIGTLGEGLRILTRLRDPFSRAVFLMFLVSEVHPFDDGNGRMARLVANAELSGSGLPKIIIPTVYREDYLLGLRALTRRGDARAYVRMLRKVWNYSSTIPCRSLAVARDYLVRTQAFKLSSEGVILFEDER